MEGTNAFVNKMNNHPTATYKGCYADKASSPVMTPAAGSMTSYSYDQCKQAAINSGYQFFALQDVDYSASTGKMCMVSNDMATATSLGTSLALAGSVALWSSNTPEQSGNTAILTDTGALSVVNSAGQSIFSTPNSAAQPSNYLGCYGDKPVRSMALVNGSQQYNLEQCQQLANQSGAAYFGLQNSTSGSTATCGLSNDLAQATKYGKAGNCTQISDGSWSGGGWSNAVYNAKTPDSNYFLILQDDGDMGVYRGTGPEDNQGLIWRSDTTSKKQSPNALYAAAKGKYGKNWISTGATLAAGDFVGSNDGSTALVMQSDGNLVLYTYLMGSNCKQMADGKMGAGVEGNALYAIDKQMFPADLLKLAFIDPNSELRPYPSSNTQYSNSYTQMPNTMIEGADIPNATVNVNLKSCQDICDNNPECAGFGFEIAENPAGVGTCTPKSSDYSTKPKLVTATDQNSGSAHNFYMRNKAPITQPAGMSAKTNNIDSIIYNSYRVGDEVDTSHGLPIATPAQKTQLANVESKLYKQSRQLNNLTTRFDTGSNNAWQQSQKNISGAQEYLSEFKSTNDKITTFSTNVENILRDSDIVVLQKNYDYLFWSILATGTVLVAMNIVKK